MDLEERLRNDAIANGKIVNEEDYTAASQEFLQKMSDIKTKIETHRTAGESAAILRSLENAEQKLADVRVTSTADASHKIDTSHQKKLEIDNGRKEQEDQNSNEYQEPRSQSKSLPMEELSIRTKSNRLSVSSKLSNTKRVLLQLEAMKKQEDIDEQLELAAQKCQAEIRRINLRKKKMDKLTEKLEIAKLEDPKQEPDKSQKRKQK